LSSLAAQLRARIGELISERDRLSAILTAMVEGVLVTDADGAVVLANPSATALLGGATVGLPVSSLLPEAEVLAAIAGRAERPSCEIHRHDRALLVTVQRLRDVGEGGAVLVLHDVTERHRLEAMRRDFIAQISHELRTPVAAIQGYAETLLSDRADAATRAEFLEVIHRQARRMGRLVADLLRLAELEARPPEQIKDEPIALAAVVAHVLETVRERAAEAEVKLDAEVDPALEVRGDPDDLEQVVQNLVDNAIRYGARPGTVRIRAERRAARVELTVADEGEGIAPEHLRRIFERFYRVDPARSRKLGGTGLGLAIVKRLVDGMRAEVRAESGPGRGARFVVSLAAREDVASR
jgi:two-component system phosphate regulon sensor histidine kinase PhoR